MDHLIRIERLVARVRWRLRWQLALRRLLILGGVGLLLFGLIVLLVKARALPTSWTWLGGAVAGALATVGALSGLLRRLDGVRLAAQLDEAGALHSRLGTALAFAREPHPTPLQRAAIEDAVTVVGRASPKAAAPWQWAAFAVGGAVAAAALAVSVPSVFAIDFPVGRAVAGGVRPLGPAPAPFARAEVALDKVEAAQLAVLEEAAARAVTGAADPEVAGFLDALNDLIRALKEGLISADEAFAKLAALEKAQAAWSEGHTQDLDAVERQLREAAEKQRKRAQEDLEPLLEALRKQALADAAEALEAAAAKLDGLSTRERQRLGREMKQLAQALESARQQQEREATKDRDRLEKKEEREKDRLSKRDRDRLKDNQRQLEQLRREHEELSEAMRQLERLQRDLDQAAEDLLRRKMEDADQGMSAAQMRQAAEMLRRLKNQAAGRQQMRAAAGRMGELRELLRRAGQRQRGGQGKDGQGPGESAMERFYARAGGKPGGDGQDGGSGKDGEGKDGATLGEGKGGQDKLTLVGLGQGPGQGAAMRVPGQGNGGQDAGDPQPGDGAGEGHDSRLLGERTRMDVKTQDDFVAGQQGDGESPSRVVYTAASKGFASAAYRDVHQDYSEVVEDDLDRQKIPPGQRTYVRRYFDLIRPR